MTVGSMNRPVTIDSPVVTAEETAKILGVSRARARELISLLGPVKRARSSAVRPVFKARQAKRVRSRRLNGPRSSRKRRTGGKASPAPR